MQILANSHKEKLMLEWQRQRRWGKHAEVGTVRDAVGMRLGVLGYGAIGRQSELLSYHFEFLFILSLSFKSGT